MERMGGEKKLVCHLQASNKETEIFYMKRMEKERVSQPSTSKQQSNRDILHGKDGKRKGIHPFTSKQQREIFYMERMEKERVFIHLQANNKERYFTWKG